MRGGEAQGSLNCGMLDGGSAGEGGQKTGGVGSVVEVDGATMVANIGGEGTGQGEKAGQEGILGKMEVELLQETVVEANKAS